MVIIRKQSTWFLNRRGITDTVSVSYDFIEVSKSWRTLQNIFLVFWLPLSKMQDEHYKIGTFEELIAPCWHDETFWSHPCSDQGPMGWLLTKSPLLSHRFEKRHLNNSPKTIISFCHYVRMNLIDTEIMGRKKVQ